MRMAEIKTKQKKTTVFWLGHRKKNVLLLCWYEHKLVNPLWKKMFIISNIKITNAYILFPHKFPPKNMFFRYSQTRTK